MRCQQDSHGKWFGSDDLATEHLLWGEECPPPEYQFAGRCLNGSDIAVGATSADEFIWVLSDIAWDDETAPHARKLAWSYEQDDHH